MLPAVRNERLALANRLLGPAPNHKFVGLRDADTGPATYYALVCACGAKVETVALSFEACAQALVSRHRSDAGLK